MEWGFGGGSRGFNIALVLVFVMGTLYLEACRRTKGFLAREIERARERETERDVKYHVALLVTCACMMYTTRLQALSLPGKECMLADYICVCDN